MKKKINFIIFFLGAIKSVSSLFLEGVTVPHTVERGNTAVLQCRYHVLQNSFDDTLYSLKWYKDEVEFFRYQPWNTREKQKVFDVPGVRVDVSASRPSEIVLKKVNFRSSGIYRCEITSSSFTISEKYQQMTVIELPHKAPSITTDVNIKEYEIGDLLELNCTSEPSHPPSELSWEMNKRAVDEENVIFRETVHNGKKLHVTRVGLRIRLTRDHFHWGKLKVACVAQIKAVFWSKGVENIFVENPETHFQVLESMEGYWIGNAGVRPGPGQQVAGLIVLFIVNKLNIF